MVKLNTNLKEYVIIVLFFLLGLSIVGQFYILIQLTDFLTKFFHITVNQSNWLTGIFGISYGIGPFFWSKLAEKTSKQTVLFLGLMLTCLTSLYLAYCTDYTFFFIGRAAQGFFASSFPPIAILWLTEHISIERRIMSVAVLSCSFLVSASFGQWFGTVTTGTSILPTMAIASGVFLCGAIFISLLPKENNSQRRESTNFFSDLKSIWNQTELHKIYLMALFMFNSLVGFYTLANGSMAPILYKAQLLPSFLRTAALPGLMCSLIVPWIIKRLDLNTILWFAISILILGQAGTLFFIYHPSIGLYFVHAVFALGVGLAVPSLISYINQNAATKTRGTAVSLYMFVLFVGGGTSPLILSTLGGHLMILVQLVVFLVVFGLFTYAVRKKNMKAAAVTSVGICATMAILAPEANCSGFDNNLIKKSMEYVKIMAPEQLSSYPYLFIAEGKKTSGKVKTQDISLFRWQKEPELNLGGVHISILINKQGELAGLARMTPQSAMEPLPEKKLTEEIARKFLAAYAPDLIPVMDIQWIKPHTDEVYIDGDKKYNINGMKMKCRSKADGTYFWVIVGSDLSVIIFERDIEWDFIKAGRQTEKWLHDDWLQKTDVKFVKEQN